jgi:hypothetical protein
MKKIISYALWGDNPKYTIGAIKNSCLARQIYPGWTARFYIHKNVDNDICVALDKAGAEIYFFETEPTWGASLYRLLPIIDTEKISHVICRDCDSRLTEREREAVRVWEESDKLIHTMKDHPYHFSFPILAGMFGCKTLKIDGFLEKLASCVSGQTYHTDQEFIQKEIYIPFQNNCMIHNCYDKNNFFPTLRIGDSYVGEPLDENDVPCNPSHRTALKNYA